jgi:hypothetical protein
MPGERWELRPEMKEYRDWAMTNSAPSDDRCDLPLLPDADHNLTDEEVQLLWSFIHGDIMNEPVGRRSARRPPAL